MATLNFILVLENNQVVKLDKDMHEEAKLM
jgi:hypothetical protein